MNILFDIGHPAHVHLVKQVARQLQHDGHRVFFTCRRQPIVRRLLSQEGFDYTIVGGKRLTLLGKGMAVVMQAIQIWCFVVWRRVDIGVSSGVVLSQVARFSRMKAVVLDDDDDAVEPLSVRWGHHHAYAVLTPDCIQRGTPHAVYYAGTHELAYLHPNRFEPDPKVLEQVGLQQGAPFFIMRFVAFHGHHDLHETGLTLRQKEQLVQMLAPHGRVLITSEKPLPASLEPYRAAIPPEKMHHLMAFATLFVGDSQTMTSEAALLGVPAVKCNTFAGRLSVPNMLERYGLCLSFTPDRFDEMCHRIGELISDPDTRSIWVERRHHFLSEHIDVSAYVAHFLEHIPLRKRRMADFTPNQYRALLRALTSSEIGYSLRHDIDAHPHRAVRMAQIEHDMGIRATYYFRHHPHGWDEAAIRSVAALGHEIGYHYESLAVCQGNMEAAYADFRSRLEELRQLAPVRSISMHGSPRSRYDNRLLWQRYDYHALGIDHEPYLDTDFNHTLYLTDTGRRWDGWRYSVRDHIASRQRQWEQEGLHFRRTADIIRALDDKAHPIHRQRLLVNVHPQRWMPFGAAWCWEWLWQTIKNPIKQLYSHFYSLH